MNEGTERIQKLLRIQKERSREERKSEVFNRRRFSDQPHQFQHQPRNLQDLLLRLQALQYKDEELLYDLKQCLASGEDSPDDFFLDPNNLLHLMSLLATSGPLQLVASHVIANLSPLNEKNGIHLARSVGPYLVTNMSSGSNQVQEASCVALGNLALSGRKVVKVLVNQEVTESLIGVLETPYEAVQSAAYYALYHILHTYNCAMSDDVLADLSSLCQRQMTTKCPLELHWVLFVLSCIPNTHLEMHSSSFIHKALDVCTYEIFQKSDSRPLVKIVTPIVRILSNLCAGNYAESSCLNVLRYPDLPAILMALLGTNYSHLCKETLWLFSNIINCDSVLVQEELIEMDFMDKMEYHTIQAIQKSDPYVVANL